MPGTLVIAAAQYPIGAPSTLAAWEEKIVRWVAEGAAEGAQLLVFPEYAAMEQAAAFGPEISGSLARSLAAVADEAEARIRFFAALARQHGVHILAGTGPVRRGTDFVNAAHLLAPSGAIGVQEKIVMTPFEHEWGVSAGGPLRVFETRLGRFGIAICYDSEFPLIARAMAEGGAEVLLVPSCTERLSGYHRVRTGAMARALENGIAAVTSPTVGDAPWSPAVDRNTGAAGVFVPPDPLLSGTGILAEGVVDEPCWVKAHIDLAALRRLRTEGETRNFRDWAHQPGAAELAQSVKAETVLLTDNH